MEARPVLCASELDPRVALEHRHDRLGELRLELPDPVAPPPPRPEAAAPAEGDVEAAVDVGDRAAHFLLRPPPPPPVHVVRADLGAGHRLPVGTDDAAADRELAAPAQPPGPVVRRDPERFDDMLALARPRGRGDARRDRLRGGELGVLGALRSDQDLQRRGRPFREREARDSGAVRLQLDRLGEKRPAVARLDDDLERLSSELVGRDRRRIDRHLQRVAGCGCLFGHGNLPLGLPADHPSATSHGRHRRVTVRRDGVYGSPR